MDRNSGLAGYGVVLVTAASRQEAEMIATSGSIPAGCLCQFGADTLNLYLAGELHQEQEWQLLIKTDLAQFQNLETKIRELHSLQVQIIVLPIVAGSQPHISSGSRAGRKLAANWEFLVSSARRRPSEQAISRFSGVGCSSPCDP